MSVISQRRAGFTIVELLIVIVVIGILAAIVIVSYRGVQNRAYISTVKSDISAATKKLEYAKAELGHYPQTLAEMPDGFKFSKTAYDSTQNNIYYCLDIANQNYALGLRSKPLNGFIATNSGVHENVSVNGQLTCERIGRDWVSDPNLFVNQGYVGSTETWQTSWKWTN